MPVITISREYGSRGEQIAQQVAKELGYSYFDKEILADVARAANATEEQIRHYDEKDEHGLRSFLKKFFIPRTVPALEWPYYASDLFMEWALEAERGEGTLEADDVIPFFRHVVESLWERGNVVIIGRGSQSILAAKPNTFHVRFVASMEKRTHTIIADEELSEADATKKIKEIDKQRERYLKRHYDANWADATLYHLVLNTGFMSVEQAARIVLVAVDRPESE